MEASDFDNIPKRDNGDRRAQDRLYGEDDVLILVDGASPVAATLLDLSVEGARVRLGGADSLPDKFRLYVPETGRTRDVVVVRRGVDDLGLGFLDV